MKALTLLCQWIDALNEGVGRCVAVVSAGLVVVVFSDVVMRYLFNTSFVFIQELEWHLFGFIFLMGAGYTLLHDGHVRVDIVYQRLTPKGRAWVNLIGVIVFLLPGCLMIIITSLKFVFSSWAILEGSPNPGGMPFRFLIKGTITVGFALLVLQGVSLGVHSFLKVIGKEPLEEHPS